jgi:beta-lactamase class A
LIFVLAVGLLCACFLDASTAIDVKPLIEKLKSVIAESGAEVSVEFNDLDAFEYFGIKAGEMHAASLMKVPVMIEVFRQAEQGKYSLDEKIKVTNEFKSIVDGSLYSLTVVEDSDDDIYKYIGQEMSLRELVFRMITVSSNLATNVLIDFVGVDNIMGTLTKLGIQGMKVLRGVEDIKAYEKDLNNRTNALSMMKVMRLIAEGKAVSPEASREMIEILSQQKYRNKIPAGIPEGVKVANKTGSITRIDHDAAIVFPEGRKPYILVIMTRGIEKREDAEKLIAELSRIVYDHVTQKEEKTE